MVHTFNMNGYDIAVDGNSGCIHVIDALCADILRLGQDGLVPLEKAVSALSGSYTEDDIAEAYGELDALVSAGQLYTGCEGLDEAAGSIGRDGAVKALCLHVSHDCNLSCGYCFASKGDYSTGRKLMPREVAFKALDFLLEHSGGRKNIEVDFFGGEPLMNMDVVRETVAYGRELEKRSGKTFHFTITTNGLLLNDQNIDFINKHMDNVVISIDGRREVHDSMRPDRGGHGTYDRILPLAKKLAGSRGGKSHFIRGTFTAGNKDFAKDVMHLAGLGFKEISIEPAVGDIGPFTITEKDLPEIMDQYERLALQYIEDKKNGADYRFYHFSLSLYEGPCIYKRVSACGAGFEYLAVSPEGLLYPCHQFVGHDGFVLGSLDTGIVNNKLPERFKGSNIQTKEECKTCWAKLFCSGGCHANAFFTNGDISKPSSIACTLQKKRLECAIMIQASVS